MSCSGVLHSPATRTSVRQTVRSGSSAVHYEVLAAQVSTYNALFKALVLQLSQTLGGTILPTAQATQLALAQAAQMVAQQAAMLGSIDHFSLIAVLGAGGMLVAEAQKVFR